jgi:hypothetical protein
VTNPPIAQAIQEECPRQAMFETASNMRRFIFEIPLNIWRCWPLYLEQVGVSGARTIRDDFLYGLLNPEVVSHDGGSFARGETAA